MSGLLAPDGFAHLAACACGARPDVALGDRCPHGSDDDPLHQFPHTTESPAPPGPSLGCGDGRVRPSGALSTALPEATSCGGPDPAAIASNGG